MPIFGDPEKKELLVKCKVGQLKKMAKDKGIEVESMGLLRAKVNKDDYIFFLSRSKKITKPYIKKILMGEDRAAPGKVGVGKKMAVKTVGDVIRKEFRIRKRYDSEAEFERDFKNWCRGRFGYENVTTQYSVGRTRIDVVVGGVGIELKLPKTARALTTLRGQVDIYKEHFGKKMIVLLVASKADPGIVADFKRDMKKKAITVIEKR